MKRDSLPQKSGSFIIGYDFSDGEDHGIVLVGTLNDKDQSVSVINEFSGEEADDIFMKLMDGAHN